MMPYRLQLVADRLRRTLTTARGMMHVDTHDLTGTVLLAGSGRSGTTWMSQIINHGNPYRDIFEPFHPQRVDQVRGWPVMRYLPESLSDDAVSDRVRDLLSGRIRSRWTDAYNRKTWTRHRLVKAIRANLMLGYIRSHLPQIKLLFAMRHPCAVVHSRVKLRWDTHLDELLAQPALMRDHLEPFRETIERAERCDDVWHKHLTMWCIENLVPLRELSQEQVHLLRYEDLCQDFDHEVASLFSFLGRPIPPAIDRAKIQTSAHFRRDSAILRGGDLLGDWQKHVLPRHIDAMLDMLQAFGLSRLYNETPYDRCTRQTVFSNAPLRAKPHISLHKDAA